MQKPLTLKQTFWFEHIEKCAAAGGALSRYAEDNSLSLKQVYSWRAAHKKYYAKPNEQAPNRFVKANIAPLTSHKISLKWEGLFTEPPILKISDGRLNITAIN